MGNHVSVRRPHGWLGKGGSVSLRISSPDGQCGGIATVMSNVSAAIGRRVSRSPRAMTKKDRQHRRLFRQLVSDWRLADLHCLMVEFESALAVRELTRRADVARPPAPSLKGDVSRLYREGSGDPSTDAVLLVDGREFAVHRAFLSRRSTFLGRILADCSGASCIPVRFPPTLTALNASSMAALLEYLYTGDPPTGEEELTAVTRFISELRSMDGQEGERSVEEDVRDMLARPTDADACLVLADERFPCHAMVIAARSALFRSILKRRGWPLEIVLDESVIAARHVPVLVHAMYTDEVDLALCYPLSNQSTIQDATDVYQMARFLEFAHLARGCEDVIVDGLTLDNATLVYDWASQAHGSDYVRRRCVDYLRQQFARVCASPILFDMDRCLLTRVLRSDFVQASEAEILDAVVRWGERELARRAQEREPNVVADTSHSISRKGVKRTDLSDQELKGILEPLLALVRVEYVLPRNHPVLTNAVSRGLVPSNGETGGRWRLFTPYMLETRASLEKRMAQCPDQLSALVSHRPHQIYTPTKDAAGPLTGRVESVLRTSGAVKRALACGCDYHRKCVIRQVSLMAVRECGLTDSTASLLERSAGQPELAQGLPDIMASSVAGQWSTRSM